MIVALAHEVRRQLVAVDRLEVTHDELNNIQATQAELENVAQEALIFTATLRAIRDRVSTADIDVARRQCERAVADLERSLEKFAAEPRQVADLRQIQRRIQEARSSIAAGWSAYATHLIRPNRDLLLLVRGLPEIAEQLNDINQLLAKLDTQAQVAPRSGSDLTRFDAHLHELEARLVAVKQLDPAIKLFLEKVRTGKATIDDLSPAVLEWCREGNHAATFTITFAPRSGAL